MVDKKPRKETALRRSIRERQEFIEYCLYWEGQLNRRDLVERFSISPQQAAADIARYRARTGKNLTYHGKRKCYVPTAKFMPRYFAPDSEQYLAALRSAAETSTATSSGRGGPHPAFDLVTSVRRAVAPETLRRVLAAIRERRSLNIHYQAFSQPEPSSRTITPHAIAYDGFRWHTRAWCHRDQDFADFLPARMLEVEPADSHKLDSTRDIAWHRLVTLKIGPDPRLSKAQRRVVELDYAMKGGVAKISTRIALSFYVERQLNLDLSSEQVPAVRQQIVLLNPDEVSASREQAKRESSEPQSR